MKIPAREVWQADTLNDVVNVIEAVAHGAKTYNDIAAAIGKVGRQGRYYRLAAEILGLTGRPQKNQSVLTSLGRRFVNAREAERRAILAEAVLSTRLAQRLVPFLEAKGRRGATRSELTHFLAEIAAFGGTSMAPRRINSIIDWFHAVGLTRPVGDNIVLQELPASVPVVNFRDDEEPLFPIRYELREYETRAREFRARGQAVPVLVDQASRERAEASHQMLIDLVAGRLRAVNSIPKANRYVDLAAKVGNENFLFEMKSTTNTNAQAQVRRGLSQLYEYRYLQQINDAKLVLVVENPLPRTLHWMADYLMNDRNVLLVWDGNNRLYCSGNVRGELPFIG